MPRYAHLPIYNSAFSLLKELYIRVPKFGKSYKYTLGNKLLDGSQEIISLIIQANSGKDRRQRIEELILKSESLTILSRIANELSQWGSEKTYLAIAEKIVGISRQLESWRKVTL